MATSKQPTKTGRERRKPRKLTTRAKKSPGRKQPKPCLKPAVERPQRPGPDRPGRDETSDPGGASQPKVRFALKPTGSTSSDPTAPAGARTPLQVSKLRPDDELRRIYRIYVSASAGEVAGVLVHRGDRQRFLTVLHGDLCNAPAPLFLDFHRLCWAEMEERGRANEP